MLTPLFSLIMLMLMAPENNSELDNDNQPTIITPSSSPLEPIINHEETPQAAQTETEPAGSTPRLEMPTTDSEPTEIAPSTDAEGPKTEVTVQPTKPSALTSTLTGIVQSKITPPVSTMPSTPAGSDHQPVTQTLAPKKKLPVKKIMIVFGLLVLFVGGITGAYLYGKSNERVVIQAPDPQPIDLPPQAVVVNECLIGRGKQYVLPKDIPRGPIYDVVNSQVIAIEYSLNITEIQTNPDAFSEVILKLTRDYPVDHFSLAPVVPKAGEPITSFHLIMFVVTKDEAAKITCE